MLFVVVGLCCAVRGYGKNGLGRHPKPPQLAGSKNRLRATLSAVDMQRFVIRSRSHCYDGKHVWLDRSLIDRSNARDMLQRSRTLSNDTPDPKPSFALVRETHGSHETFRSLSERKMLKRDHPSLSGQSVPSPVQTSEKEGLWVPSVYMRNHVVMISGLKGLYCVGKEP
jgi:hypothetical protein